MRVAVKGGVWKNTEDEILKAAISKYGKNQWARISSLLVRKTPKQCKARWYEWLDPSIKKTEWSKEEDEKLLHLAKLMPTQWRTIAPIVGRTATQCLERYQKLLDEAEQRDDEEGEGRGAGAAKAGPSGSRLGLTGPDGGESAPTADDVRRLRPGEIDPDPETKPARPDAVDMDEDEKEMLSEARARLANTQGKKAKRKARERALEEARRLALLQKRRELKAAGISTKAKPPKKGMDYMTDIPFEKQPAVGFYDTSEEDARAVRAPIGKTIGQLDNPNRARREEEERKRKQKEAEQRKKQSEDGKESFSRQREEQLRRIKEEEQISKRRKLNLPEAQVGQRELDDIVKMGLASESARDLVISQRGGAEGSEGLLGDYSALNRAREARTPRTAPEEDTVMREARNLRNLANTQTPLLGDANVEQYEGMASKGALPPKSISQTPNPLLTPMTNQRDLRGGPSATPYAQTPTSRDQHVRDSSTPMRTPLRTPLRDNLGLNADDNASVLENGDSRREMKRSAQAAKARLQQGLMNLPAPKNDFEIVLDDEADQAQEEEVAGSMQDGVLLEEDATEQKARLAKEQEAERAREWARQSEAVRRNLPRPANIDVESMLTKLGSAPRGADGLTRARFMIAEEMVHLAKHDSLVHPIAGSMSAGGSHSGLPRIPDSNLAAAKELIRQDMLATFAVSGADGEAQVQTLINDRLDVESEQGRANLDAFESSLRAICESVAWDAEVGEWRDRDVMSAQQIVAGQSKRLDAMRHEMTRQANTMAKEEKRLGKLLGGYQARSKALSGSIVQAFRSLEERSVEHQAFQRLFEREQIAAEERRRALEEEVAHLERRERLAQSVYRERDERRKELRAQIEALEDEVAMREAEKINDAALARATAAEGHS